jgi:hypothetical protein
VELPAGDSPSTSSRREVRIRSPLRLVAYLLLSLAAGLLPPGAAGQETVTVLRAGWTVGGRGGLLPATDIVIRGGRIVEMAPAGQGMGTRIYDLRHVTVLLGAHFRERHRHL